MHWLEAESCKEQDSPPRRRRCRSQGLGPVAQGRDPLLWGQILAAARQYSEAQTSAWPQGHMPYLPERVAWSGPGV